MDPGTPAPFILGIGGSTRLGSTSELLLRRCLTVAEEQGAIVDVIAGPVLNLPIYDPCDPRRTAAAERLVHNLRRADGIIVASPCYHGSVSGLIKNVLDYAEDLAGDSRPYFQDRAVGCILCAQGDQALGMALSALRSIIHSLRGWPTPFGATFRTRSVYAEGALAEDVIARPLTVVASQVVEFARMRLAFYDKAAPATSSKASSV